MKTFLRCGYTSALAILFLSLLTLSVTAQGSKYGQFAPEDAFENGSKLAYYGSENEWSRRQFMQEKADDIYGRRGQRQLLSILNQDPKQALQWAAERLEEDPADLESPFMETIAYCQLQQVDKAFEAMQRAVAGGLPAERFLAGPRDLLQPLTSTDRFQEFIADRTNQLIHGPMLGSVTDHSARVWVRTKDETTVFVNVYACDDNGAATDNIVTSGRSETSADRDYTAVVEVSQLQPQTVYRYDVLANGQSVLAGEKPRFKTFSATGSPEQLKIIFGGGAGYTPDHEHMWDTIQERRPDALLLLGDNVYIDLPEEPRGLHQYTYYRRQSRPEFRSLVASTPVYAVWDDHDCAMDDVWMGPYLDRPSWKPAMLKIFEQNWVNPAYGNGESPGCWFTANLAGVDFFFLDTRYFRTNPFGDHPTMLGPAQKQEFLSWLKRSKAPFKVIVSSVPFAPDAKPGSHDTWDGFAEERQEILDCLEENRIEGVVILSADRHRTDVRKIERKGAYPLYDFMSSKLTNEHTHECVPGALFCYNETCSCGQVTFDYSAADPLLEFQAVDLEGETLYTLSIRLSELSYQ